MQFVVIRLGKDSVTDIEWLNSPSALESLPFAMGFACTQVEQGIAENDYAIIWLGSNNSVGQPTPWKQGIRAIAKVVQLDRGASFNDESKMQLEIVSVLPESIDQFDFLDKSASHFKYFSKYPVVGIRSTRNNAIQKVNEEDRQKTPALLTAISILFPEVRDQLGANAPELLKYLDYVPVGEAQAAQLSSSNISDDDKVWEWISDEIFKKNERNFLFLGAPGTGKTWYAREIAKKLTSNDPLRYSFIQFHPSFSYDDFVEGYTPKLSASSTAVEYRLHNKHFLELCDKAKSDGSNLYVIVIDELTRGDPSRVFGELFTYLEVEHRNKEFSLTYSGTKSFIPGNLVVLATANPYDRSVGELDDALVRRFAMRDFPPDSAILKQHLTDIGASASLISRLLHVFQIFNERVPNGFGHSHFWNIRTEDDFRMLWKSRILFLLKRAFVFDETSLENLRQEIESVFPEPTKQAVTDSSQEADGSRSPPADEASVPEGDGE